MVCFRPGGDGFVRPQSAAVERIDDGLVVITLQPGVRITAAHGSIVRNQLITVFNGQPAGVLLRLAGVAMIDREAMVQYAQAVTVTALALVGQTPVDRLVAHRLVGLTLPKCPNQYFTDTEEALDWLRTRPQPGA
jgi:hypothetical protein